NRVLMIAGITDQRPARAVGPAEEVEQLGRASEALLAPPLAHPLRKPGRQLQRLQEVLFDVGTERVKRIVRPADDDTGQPMMSGEAAEAAMLAGVELDRVQRYAAPVTVVGAGERWPGVVGRRLNLPGDERVIAIGADHYPGPLHHGRARGRSAGDTANAVAVPDEILDREAFAQLRTSLDGGIDQELVEHDTPGAISLRDVTVRRRRSSEGEGTEIH